MDIVLWIFVCMLACMGVACIIGDWAYVRRSRRMAKSNYRVITLYDDPVDVEARLNQTLLRLAWDGRDGTIILVDMGMGEKALIACKRAKAEMFGAHLCTPAELPELLRGLDAAAHEPEPHVVVGN
jgi:hypothetical protein